jgi:DNA-binding Lrp family transcriptional regulator
MDSIDRRILRELQADGRLSNHELAARVGLSASPCLRRVRRLEEEGVIRGYRADIAPEAVGRGFEVFVSVDVRRNRQSLEEFEAEAAGIPEVIEAYRLYGAPGHLLRIAVADSEEYERFWIERLTALPGITDINSQMTMKRVKESSGLPI